MLKMVNTEFEVMIFDDEKKLFLVLKNPYNNSSNDVYWQLPKADVGDVLMEEKARKLLENEYSIILNNSEIFCACESITDLNHLISIGLVSNDSDVSNTQINDIKTDIAYCFYDMDSLPKNLLESSKQVIKKYKERKKIGG